METNGNTALKRTERYTYKDLQSWPEGERWELIRGEAFCMSPAPVRKHQWMAGELFAQLRNQLKGKPCVPYISPIDVFLAPEGWDRDKDDADKLETVVQPDILVVCDPAKQVDEGILGAPDFIIEVLSPATAFRDLTAKRALYEAHRVREYWTVNPETQEVQIYELSGSAYGLPRAANLRDPVPVAALPGVSLRAEA